MKTDERWMRLNEYEKCTGSATAEVRIHHYADSPEATANTRRCDLWLRQVTSLLHSCFQCNSNFAKMYTHFHIFVTFFNANGLFEPPRKPLAPQISEPRVVMYLNPRGLCFNTSHCAIHGGK